MIRKLLNGDIDKVADIWLKTNLKSTLFISHQYLKSYFELVKGNDFTSEIYVFGVINKKDYVCVWDDDYYGEVCFFCDMELCRMGRFYLILFF